MKKFCVQLKKQRDDLEDLDDKILEHLLKNEDEDVCDKDMDDSSDYMDKITDALMFMEEKLGENEETASVASGSKHSIARSVSEESLVSNESQKSTSSERTKRRVRVKLPKLEIKKFSGKIHEYQEFWDSFRSAIHENDELADVDKLKYLKGYLEEPARSMIGGLPMTDSNYTIAVELLKKRYAKPSMIQHAHINQLINLQPIFNEDNVTRLRSFRDQIEAHYRGLEAISVDKLTYSKIVVPVLMEKLPKQIRIGMVRSAGKSMLEWSVDEMISALDLELEVRECHTSLLKTGIVGASSEGRRPPYLCHTRLHLHFSTNVPKFCRPNPPDHPVVSSTVRKTFSISWCPVHRLLPVIQQFYSPVSSCSFERRFFSFSRNRILRSLRHLLFLDS